MYIQFLDDAFGNDAGDIVPVEEETEGELYYYDCFGRWCYVLRSEEGELYQIVDGPEGEDD